VTAYVVRHAKAGDRADWEGDDRLRPLSKPGKRQAEGLVELLKDANLEVVLSSPYLRCIETVDPVARHFGLQVAQERSLAEGQTGDSIVQLVRRFAGRNVVLCTHGDVLEDLLEHLIRDGLVARAGAKLEKGSIWALDESAGRIVMARYIPAP
jgi:8-oxo-dGTP diphosphatase